MHLSLDKPIVKLNLEARSTTSLSFTWSLLSDSMSNLHLQYYTLRYRMDQDSTWLTERISSQVNSFVLTDLQPYTLYTVQLLATNFHFTSDPSHVTAMTGAAGKIETLYCVKDILVVCWYCL